MARLLSAILLGLMAVGGVSADDVGERSRELEDLRTRIQRHRAKAQELERDERSQLARLSELDKEMALTGELLVRLAERETAAQADLERLRAAADSLDVTLAGRRDRLAQRLRAMYMRPRQDGLTLLLGSEDLGHLSVRMKAMTHIARTERALLDGARDHLAGFAARRAAVQVTLADLQATRNETETRRARLAQAEAERKATVAELRRERKGFEASVAEMERAAEELAELIAGLESSDRATPMPSTGFALREGSLPWPVRGAVVRPFGESIHPRFGTVVPHKGITISAAMGTPIRAVADGVVDFVDWLPGYGKCLIVSHGDGYYTLYAHASSLFPTVGATVAAGDVVGEVGDSGSLEGSQLYFEVRKGREALDPTPWLSRPSR